MKEMYPFIISFRKIEKWLGYSKKETAVAAIKRYCTEGVDFIVRKEKYFRTPYHNLWLTPKALKTVAFYTHDPRRRKQFMNYYLRIERQLKRIRLDKGGDWDNKNAASLYLQPENKECGLDEIHEPRTNKESKYRDDFAISVGGQTEVRTEVGVADVVTQDAVYEIKSCRQWKAAVGQVLMYNQELRKSKKAICLFDHENMDTDKIRLFCQKVHVSVILL